MQTRARTIEQILEKFHSIKRKFAATKSAMLSGALRHVTQAQWDLLRLVARGENLTTKDIAGQLGISSSAATQLIDVLVERGVMKRADNPDDRRSQYITLTTPAKNRMNALREKRLEALSQLFSALSDKELEQYLALSAKIADSSALSD